MAEGKKSLKQTIILWALFVFFALALYIGLLKPFGAASSVGVNAAAPDFEVAALDGTKTRLSDSKGKVVFLNFWATWCPPCRRELDDIQDLRRKMFDKPFVIMAISVDEASSQDVADFMDRRGVKFPAYHDSSMKIAEQYGVSGFPETFIIDKQGKVVDHFIGPRQWASLEMVDYFTKLMNKP